MDYNQPYQIQYNFYQNSPQQNQPQQPQQAANQGQQRTPSSAYFQPIQAQDTLRSMQPSPSSQSYSSLVLDMSGSPAPIHRVIVSAPQHHQRLQLLQSPSVIQQQNTSPSSSGYFGTFSSNQPNTGGGRGGSGSSLDFVAELQQQFYHQQRSAQEQQQRHSAQDSQFFQVAQSIRQQQQQQQQTQPCSTIFSREIASSGRPISASSRQFAAQPPRIAQRPLVSSSSLFITSENSFNKQDIWGTEGTFLEEAAATNANLKTPMALIVDLAKRHKVGVSYQTTAERFSGTVGGGKIYTVCLQLGDEQHFGIGNSIARAQQNAAQEALRASSYVSSSRLPRPHVVAPGGGVVVARPKVTSDPAKPGESNNGATTKPPQPQPNNREASMTATVELNALAMKYRLKVVYEDQQVKRPVFVNGRQTIGGIFIATCKIGSHQFAGEGQTRKDARQASAKAALESLKNKAPDELLAVGIGTPPNLQSEVSQIYDFAARRGLTVKFQVEIDQPLPDQTFVTICTLGGVDSGGELTATGRGKSKKEAKQKACIEMLAKIHRQVPVGGSGGGGNTNASSDGGMSIVDAIRASSGVIGGAVLWRPAGSGSRRIAAGQQMLLQSRKQPAAEAMEPNYLLDINPISRLFQIFQAIKNGVLPSFIDEIHTETEKEKVVGENFEPEPTTEAEKPPPQPVAEKPAAATAEKMPPIAPTLDASTKISVKPTHDGKYVLLLNTPPLASSQPTQPEEQQQQQPPPKLKITSRKRGKFYVRCTCGDKSVIGEGRNQKLAKAAAATEMLKLLNYNVPPPPPSPPTPPPLLDPEEAAAVGVSGRKGHKKRSSGGDEVAKKKQQERKAARAEAAEAGGRVQLFFHPALFAPPKSKSFNPSGLLTANDLIGTSPKTDVTMADITIIAKKLIALKKPSSGSELLKVVEEVGSTKLEKLSLGSCLENEEELASSPNFVILKVLCGLAGKVPTVTQKLNNASHLVFVDLADAMFCGEGTTQAEALESVASRLVDSIASTVIGGGSSAPPIILTEEDLVPQTAEQDEPEVLPTALMVEENNNNNNSVNNDDTDTATTTIE